MNKDKKFSEMLHGDMAWMKYQSLMNRETVQRAIRSGKSVLMLDAETDFRWTMAMTAGRGFGKGLLISQALRKRAVDAEKLKRIIDAGSPALAAEQRCTGKSSELMAVALMELRERNMQALRLWNKVNWHHNYLEGKYNR